LCFFALLPRTFDFVALAKMLDVRVTNDQRVVEFQLGSERQDSPLIWLDEVALASRLRDAGVSWAPCLEASTVVADGQSIDTFGCAGLLVLPKSTRLVDICMTPGGREQERPHVRRSPLYRAGTAVSPSQRGGRRCLRRSTLHERLALYGAIEQYWLARREGRSGVVHVPDGESVASFQRQARRFVLLDTNSGPKLFRRPKSDNESPRLVLTKMEKVRVRSFSCRAC
jgi:hypothetical protein